MKVVVTGSSGLLGQALVRTLDASGHVVVPVDRRPNSDGPQTIVVDLLDQGTHRELLAGADAVVHAAVAGMTSSMPDLIASNVELTATLALSSRAAGVRRFIHLSTIQVIGSERTHHSSPPEVAYLPLDGDSPANPRNAYAWSKFTSEVVARAFASDQTQCVILRLPWLTTDPRRPGPRNGRERDCMVEQGFSYLTLADAARLVSAVLVAELPGVRTYLPAVSAVPSALVARYISRYYPRVPLRAPAAEMPSLIDTSRITVETGWRPQDLGATVQTTSGAARWLRHLLPVRQ